MEEENAVYMRQQLIEALVVSRAYNRTDNRGVNVTAIKDDVLRLEKFIKEAGREA